MQLRYVDPVVRQRDALQRLWGAEALPIARRYLEDSRRLRRSGQIQFWQDVVNSLTAAPETAEEAAAAPVAAVNAVPVKAVAVKAVPAKAVPVKAEPVKKAATLKATPAPKAAATKRPRATAKKVASDA